MVEASLREALGRVAFLEKQVAELQSAEACREGRVKAVVVATHGG